MSMMMEKWLLESLHMHARTHARTHAHTHTDTDTEPTDKQASNLNNVDQKLMISRGKKVKNVIFWREAALDNVFDSCQFVSHFLMLRYHEWDVDRGLLRQRAHKHLELVGAVLLDGQQALLGACMLWSVEDPKPHRR
jgi:hypothetical protein